MSEEEGFRVSDRRGRGDVAARVAPAASTAAPADATSSDRGGRAAASEFRAGPSELGALFLMFASSALINLGAVAQPETDERRLDLEQARAAIDVLVMLRDKTRGNRTEQESRFLEDLLYDLQMRFVSVARGPAQSDVS